MLRITTESMVEKAWSRIGNTEWDQMAWFVKLANASDLVTLSPEQQRIWQEEFMAMLLRNHEALTPPPQASKRYPRSGGESATGIDWPSTTEMLAVQEVVKRQIDSLADGKETWIPEQGTFNVDYSVKLMANPRYAEDTDKEPRYLVYHHEVASGSYPRTFLLRLLRLLTSYSDKNRQYICADKIRRCLKCKTVFLQVKRSSRYCSAACYTVACMRRLREERKCKHDKKRSKKTSKTLLLPGKTNANRSPAQPTRVPPIHGDFSKGKR